MLRLLSILLILFGSRRHVRNEQKGIEDAEMTVNVSFKTLLETSANYISFLAQREKALSGEAPQIPAGEISTDLDNIRFGPDWEPLVIFNGAMEWPATDPLNQYFDVILPGWSHHGGRPPQAPRTRCM